MLTAEGCRQRRARLWASLPEKPDWILLHEPLHLVYFASYCPSPFVYRTQNAGAMLILGADGSSLLIADNLLQPFAEKAFVDRVESPVWYRGHESAPPRSEVLVRAALEAMKARPGDRIGFEPEVPAGVLEGLRAARPDLQPIDVGPAIPPLRRRKDADEIAVLRLCMKAVEVAMTEGMRGIRPGMTELQAYALVQKAAIEAADEPVIVYGDFAAGPRVETGGGPPGSYRIEKNDLVLLDFSVVIHGYRGDIANTFVADGGMPTPRQREMAGYCLAAMQVGESLLKAGAECRAIDRAVRDVFRAHDVSEYFSGHMGHGLGLGHPDPPYIVAESADTLVTGDVVTLEPGLYIRGEGGMRFERNYLVTETGYETLTHHPIGLE